MSGQIRAFNNLMTMLTASGTTIGARVARMAADPHKVAADPETMLMVTEKMSAMGEAGMKAVAAMPAWSAAWQRWWWSRAFAFHPQAANRADHQLMDDLRRVMEQASAAMQTPFRRRAVANARRLSV
ncbi:hypothetical protein [Geminicoccus roseus]|uniref:hypothetical protein n=1 Tax=Geminicoccus roseus TaxID=404900 RepID=UPI00040BF597|nr:hypothetical protein [Geminicoccus roseus]